MTCAISTARKDAIIEKVTAEVTHEAGQKLSFQWWTLNETFSQVRGPEGVTEVTKNQPAVALKVSTLVLTEKKIGMVNEAFREARAPLIADLLAHHNHLRRTKPDDWQDVIRGSRELDRLLELVRRSQPWQVGRYEVRLSLRLALAE